MKKIALFALLLLLGTIALYYLYNSRFQRRDPLTLFGNVDVRQVEIGFRVSGRIIELFPEEGDLVEVGDPIATLDPEPYLDELKRAEGGVTLAKVNAENNEKLSTRRAELAPDGGVSKEDLENAENALAVALASLTQAEASLGVARTNLNDTQVFSPVKGTLLTRIREPGTVVRAADPVCTISILDPVWVRCFIPEPLLGVVYPGMKAKIFTDTPGGKVYEGHVGFISPVAEFTPKNVETLDLRTDLVFRLRVIADNPDLGLRQGMPVTVKLIQRSEDGADHRN